MESFLKCMRQRPMPEDFAGTSIKAVSIGGDVELNTALDILLMCKGIQILSLVVEGNGYCENAASLLQLIDTLPSVVRQTSVLHLH
jgi:hypothetical protein